GAQERNDHVQTVHLAEMRGVGERPDDSDDSVGDSEDDEGAEELRHLHLIAEYAIQPFEHAGLLPCPAATRPPHRGTSETAGWSGMLRTIHAAAEGFRKDSWSTIRA